MKSNLYKKAVKFAISEMKRSRTRDESNKIYKKWICFKDDFYFKTAIKNKQEKFTKHEK